MADLASQPTSIQSIYNWYREDRLFVNRKYQRKLVWTLEEKQKLVDSIIKKYPIPAILIAEKSDNPGTYEIIDGLQRLHAVVSFIETSFPTLDGTYFDISKFPTATTYCEDGTFEDQSGGAHISAKDVSTILDYTLALSVMRNATEAEINDVFDRINTYGHRLSDQERRQSGVQNAFSALVRATACEIRGDVSTEVLPLYSMPAVSIDLPMSKHGYEVQADEVFWVAQGILRSTDLRDSMDEQCIADIAACLVGQELIERSKDALDAIYEEGSDQSENILAALEVYGANKFIDEFKFCIQEIIRVAEGKKLRDIVFSKRTTNPFPSVFAAIMIAFHEIIIGEENKISNYSGLGKSITGLSDRIDTSRKATSPEERRKNIDTIKGLIKKYFVSWKDNVSSIYSNHTVLDVENVIRRSEVEVSHYELKQGLLKLEEDGGLDENLRDKLVKTICAIANNGPNSHGKIIIGVSDSKRDAELAQKIDGIAAQSVGLRHVVGVAREAKRLGKSPEDLFGILRDYIKNSKLSDHLKSTVLSGLDYNNYYGLGVIIIAVPAQKQLSYVGEEVFWRDGSSTRKASTPKEIAELAQRF